MKDWTGNKRTTFAILGASSHAQEERQEHDYYATDPIAMEMLLDKETFNKNVWECAVGEGHLANVLKQHDYNVRSSDLINRGYENTEILNFLEYDGNWQGDIITNPPYKYAQQFVEKAFDVMKQGKIAMFLKLTFLESKGRYEMFRKYPPKTIYVFSERVVCAMNGDFEKYTSSAVAYAWFIWEVGFKGKPQIEWLSKTEYMNKNQKSLF